jgi:hypothetical protein
MKLIDYFDAFLKNDVNLDDARLGRLHASVEAVTAFLEQSETFRDNFIDTIPQGSLAHKTIIKPVRANDEFDADLLLQVDEFDDWEPADYVEQLYAAFRASGTYRDKVHRRTRCVVIDYAGDFHMDVVPYLDRHASKFITNRRDNRFELTDPEGYNAWLEEKNRTTGRHLVKVIRLLKYLRDFKCTFDIRSVVLNVLVGQQVNEAALLGDPGCYADVPTTLRTVTSRLNDYLVANPYLPAIMDPSGTGDCFSDRWDQDGYASFRSSAMLYAQWIDDAWSEPDVSASLQKWQRVFGDKFQAPQAKEVSAALVKAVEPSVPATFTNTEQNLLRDFGIPFRINPKYKFRITGRVSRDGGLGAYFLRGRGNRVRRGRRIRFTVTECNVPEPYTIYWKVSNRGPEAISNNCIRGQIEACGREWRIHEATNFIGPHFVEAYVVSNGVCIATDRQDVIII